MLKILKLCYRMFRCVRECVINLFFILFILLLIPAITFFSTTEKTSKSLFTQGALRLNLEGYLADNREEFADFYRLLQSEMGGLSRLKFLLLMSCKPLIRPKMIPKLPVWS